jgi:pSer/pThr/pTyr-binding forkhead associated (FHA) protein
LPLWIDADKIFSVEGHSEIRFTEIDNCAYHLEVVMLTILLKFKNSEIKTIETDKGEITIGRNPANDIHIDNLGVSKQHAKISKQDGAYVIEDLNSTNGTFLNNKRIAKAILNDSDEVHIGKHSLKISVQPQSTASPDQDFGDKTIVLTSE